MKRNKNIILGIFICVVEYLSIGVSYSLFSLLFANNILHIHNHIVILGYLLSMNALGQFIFSFFWAYASDYYGRKNILYYTIIGSCVANLLTAIALIFHSLILLFVSRFLVGCFTANLAIIQSSITDYKQENNKKSAILFNYLEIGIGSGLLLGSILGSWFVSNSYSSILNFSFPFIAISILYLNLIFCVFCAFLRPYQP